ncbi:MAG: hypothetical protein ACRCX7_02510 [Cetobacterium sp.]|uniref:hypothetical protein n=1 Tax=Cetobacterium sp. TaxID=2071632 RepID=UPI003F3155B4
MKLFWDIVAWVMIGSSVTMLLGGGYIVSSDCLGFWDKVPDKINNIILKVFGASFGICCLSTALSLIYVVLLNIKK